MPSLQGYQVQTHLLMGGREVDVLHPPDHAEQLLVSGQQVGELTGDGRRSTGHCSTSDMGRLIDKQYQLRVPDPHKLYSRSRVRSTTLFAVVGLIQRTFHTTRTSYIRFCREFIDHVLPRYPAFAAHHAELVMTWYGAIDHFDAVGDNMDESTFRAAIAARDLRAKTYSTDVPMLVLATIGRDQVICTGEPPAQLRAVPLFDGRDALTFDVARLRDVHALLVHRHSEHPDWPRLTPCLVMCKPDGSIVMAGGEIVAPTRPQRSSEQTGPTADDVRQALRTLMRDELPTIVEPIIQRVIRANVDHGQQARSIRGMTKVAEQLVEITVINREQLELSRQSIDLITPSHQLFLSAQDYVEMDGVEDALRRAPKLAAPSFGLDHCPDFGKASLWMKKLCRDENKKVAANAVARIIAKDAGQELPPLYIPEFRMKRLTRDHVKVLMFNPACWARCKQTFLAPGTPTLLFPGPKTKAAEDKPKAEEA